jgi:hypothetical protein
MESQASPAEELPALYRAVLEGVGSLERHGERTAAAAIRREATAAYSAAWDERHRAQLLTLHARVRRELARLDPRHAGLRVR